MAICLFQDAHPYPFLPNRNPFTSVMAWIGLIGVTETIETMEMIGAIGLPPPFSAIFSSSLTKMPGRPGNARMLAYLLTYLLVVLSGIPGIAPPRPVAFLTPRRTIYSPGDGAESASSLLHFPSLLQQGVSRGNNTPYSARMSTPYYFFHLSPWYLKLASSDRNSSTEDLLPSLYPRGIFSCERDLFIRLASVRLTNL